jgi:hypothetical protein
MLTERGGDAETLELDNKWLTDVMADGEIPVRAFKNNGAVMPGDMGTIADIEYNPEKPEMLIEYIQPPACDTTPEEFWRVPDHALRPQNVPIPVSSLVQPSINYTSRLNRSLSSAQIVSQLPQSLARIQQASAEVPVQLARPAQDPVNKLVVHDETESDTATEQHSEVPVSLADEFASAVESSDANARVCDNIKNEKVVYIPDLEENIVWKGIVQSRGKGKDPICVVRFHRCHVARHYFRSELYGSRKGAVAALESMRDKFNDDPETDTSDDDDVRPRRSRGRPPKKKKKNNPATGTRTRARGKNTGRPRRARRI